MKSGEVISKIQGQRQKQSTFSKIWKTIGVSQRGSRPSHSKLF